MKIGSHGPNPNASAGTHIYFSLPAAYRLAKADIRFPNCGLERPALGTPDDLP